MSRILRTRSFALLALAALMASTGCSSLPTGPSPEVAAAPASAGAAEPAGLLPSAQTQPATSSRVIYGAVGGRVSAGNFTVVIPPLAIPGTATVTVTQRDVTKPYVSLHITPASANKFRLPVVLIADASPLSEARLGVAYISWYNPSTRRWERMASSSVNLLDRTVICTLRHFSDYAVQVDGKAGW